MTGELQKKRRFLAALLELLQDMQAELSQRNTALPEVFLHACTGNALLSESLQQCAQLFRAGNPSDRALLPLRKTTEAAGLPDAAEELSLLTHFLGKYDSETQVQACHRTEEKLRTRLQILEQTLSEKRRLYCTVACSVGAMLALAVS